MQNDFRSSGPSCSDVRIAHVAREGVSDVHDFPDHPARLVGRPSLLLESHHHVGGWRRGSNAAPGHAARVLDG
jgi:hypothetical protein